MADDVRAYALKAAGLTDPIGVPNPEPTLSWRLGHDTIAGQPAVIRFATTERDLDDAESFTIGESPASWPLAPLRTAERLLWQIGLLRADGEYTWSAPASIQAPTWDLGSASAITHPSWVDIHEQLPLPELQLTLNVPPTTVSATLSFTSNGVVVPLIDDVEAIAGQLEPGYSQPGGSTPAVSWNVTEQLTPGEHTLRLTLGSGMAFLPTGDRYTKYERRGSTLWVRACLELRRAEGDSIMLVTDESWAARLGDTVEAHWYGGEEFVPGSRTEWQPAAVVVHPGHHWRSAPSIQVTEHLHAQRVLDSGGEHIYDWGVNAAGRPRVTLPAPSSATVTLRPSELLSSDSIDQSTTGTPIFDRVKFEPTMTEWAPKFTYHGARYLAVDGAPDDIGVEFEVMRVANEAVQQFNSSSEFLNRLHTIIDRAVQSNMYSVFTDCPHREKLGWLEQLFFCFDTLARGYDVSAHLLDAVGHMIAAQTSDGLVPNIAPEHVVFNFWPSNGDMTAFRDDPNWGRAILEVPWLLYKQYGDPTAMKLAWDAGKRYLGYLEGREVDGLLDFGLGDWITVDPSTPVGMVCSWGYAKALDTAALIAEALGDVAADDFRTAATRTWRRWRDTYFDTKTTTWGSGSQASWALALDSPAVSQDQRPRVYDQLLASIEAAGFALTVGEIALPSLIAALAAREDDALLLQMIQRIDTPGYGMQLYEGATSLTESWAGTGGEEGVASQNHFMLGAIDSWITGRVAGLRQHTEDVGWRHVVIDPADLDEVPHVQVQYESPYGRFEVRLWTDETGARQLRWTAPPGAVVDVIRPARFQTS